MFSFAEDDGLEEKKNILSFATDWWRTLKNAYVKMICIKSPSTPLCNPNGISAASHMARSRQSWPLYPALQEIREVQWNAQSNKVFIENYAFNFLSIDLYKFVRVTRLLLAFDERSDSVDVVVSSFCSFSVALSASLSEFLTIDSLSGFELVDSEPKDRTKSNCNIKMGLIRR